MTVYELSDQAIVFFGGKPKPHTLVEAWIRTLAAETGPKFRDFKYNQRHVQGSTAVGPFGLTRAYRQDGIDRFLKASKEEKESDEFYQAVELFSRIPSLATDDTVYQVLLMAYNWKAHHTRWLTKLEGYADLRFRDQAQLLTYAHLHPTMVEHALPGMIERATPWFSPINFLDVSEASLSEMSAYLVDQNIITPASERGYRKGLMTRTFIDDEDGKQLSKILARLDAQDAVDFLS
jgi:hypothetical protein